MEPWHWSIFAHLQHKQDPSKKYVLISHLTEIEEGISVIQIFLDDAKNLELYYPQISWLPETMSKKEGFPSVPVKLTAVEYFDCIFK